MTRLTVSGISSGEGYRVSDIAERTREPLLAVTSGVSIFARNGSRSSAGPCETSYPEQRDRARLHFRPGGVIIVVTMTIPANAGLPGVSA
jgi:hypothetical protein